MKLTKKETQELLARIAAAQLSGKEVCPWCCREVAVYSERLRYDWHSSGGKLCEGSAMALDMAYWLSRRRAAAQTEPPPPSALPQCEGAPEGRPGAEVGAAPTTKKQ